MTERVIHPMQQGRHISFANDIWQTVPGKETIVTELHGKTADAEWHEATGEYLCPTWDVSTERMGL